MSRRIYLYGELGDGHADKVRCPNWQCSGFLYLKFEKHFDGPEREDGWQMPSLVCDDCHTVWRNGMLDQ